MDSNNSPEGNIAIFLLVKLRSSFRSINLTPAKGFNSKKETKKKRKKEKGKTSKVAVKITLINNEHKSTTLQFFDQVLMKYKYQLFLLHKLLR